MKKWNWLWSNQALSIDIGSYCTKFVVGKQKQGKVIIEQAFSVPTPLESYKDGKISNVQSLFKNLSQALQNQKVKVKSVMCTIESTAIIYRELFLPISKPKVLNQMLKIEVQQNLPIELEQYIIQGRILEKIQEESTFKYRVLVAAVPKNIVKSYIQLLELLSLKPIAIDLHSNGISKLVKNSNTINDQVMIQNKTIAIIDIGYSMMNVVILENGIFRFNRLLPIGSQEIDMNIANSFNLTLEEAEKKKMDLQQYKEKEKMPNSLDWLQKSMEITLEYWAKEIEKVFRYYTSRSFTHVIDAIYLHGGSASMETVLSYFQVFFNLPVERMQKMDCIQWGNSSQELYQYINAVATLLRK